MRIVRIPVRQEFGEGAKFESGFPPQTFNDGNGTTESGAGEYMPGFADTPEPAKQTQAKLEPVISTPNEEDLSLDATAVSREESPASESPSSPADAAQGNRDGASQLVDVQGNPVKTSEAQTAQTPTPARPLPSQQEPFDLSSIDPIWYLCLIPAVLFPLLLFRFVMGTSSAYELERYKYRGPAVKNPEAPNVRGRFKKKPRTDQTRTSDSAVAKDAVDNSPENETNGSNESVAPDDELSFLVEDENDVLVDSPSLLGNAIETVVPASDLATDLTSEPFEPGDFDLHGDDEQHQFVETQTSLSNPSSESKTLSNPTDSELDFDFFSDDDDLQTNEVAASDKGADTSGSIRLAEEPSELEEAVDAQGVEEQAITSGAQSDDEDAKADFVAVSGESSSLSLADVSDDDLSFFDDSDGDFSFEDDENGDEVSVVAASAGTETEAIEELGEPADLESNDQTEDSQDRVIETAVVGSAAGVAAVAATAKSGSWMSRLFGGRKKKQKKNAASPAKEDAIATTAGQEPDEIIDSEELTADSQPLTETVEDQVFVETAASTSIQADEQSAEFDFSNSSESMSFDNDDESFSLEGDDSSDDLFDDDSDAGYDFDADGLNNVSLVDVDESADVAGIKTSTDEGQDSVDDFESMWDEADELQTPVNALVDAQPEAGADDLPSGGAAERSAEEVSSGASLPAANSGAPGEEFHPVGNTNSPEELPLLEDQMPGEIVVSDVGDSDGRASLPAVDVAAGDSSAVLLSELQRRVEELESQNAEMELDRASLVSKLEELDAASENKQVSTEDQQKHEELQQQLADERQAKQELEERLAVEAEAKQQAVEAAEQARTEVEHTAAEVTKFRQQAEEALASVRELEQAAESQNPESQNRLTGSLGGSLLAAAGGAVAGAAVAGGAEQPFDADDPFRLEPEQVKKMLMKLKVERKKRLKTKEHFLQADAKRREVAQRLKKVTAELDNMKLEFEKVSSSSSESVSKETAEASNKATVLAQASSEGGARMTNRLEETKLAPASMTPEVSAAEATAETEKVRLEQRDRLLNSLTGQLAQAQSMGENLSDAAETLAQRDRKLNELTAQLAQLQLVNEQLTKSNEDPQNRLDETSA